MLHQAYNPDTPHVKPPAPVGMPSLTGLVLGFIPFVGMCFSVPIWDRVDPMIFGLPFNLAWLMAWIVISTLCMAAAYRVESARDKRNGGGG
jgi:hypothetical protein